MVSSPEPGPGQVLPGVVTGIKPYGAFVQLSNGEIGLVHISEVAEEYVHAVSDYLSVGDEVIVKVIGRNAEGKLNLSLKRVSPQDEHTLKYDLETQAVQRSLSEREGQPVPVPTRSQLPRPQPLLQWMREARQTLEALERRTLRAPERGDRRGRRPRRA